MAETKLVNQTPINDNAFMSIIEPIAFAIKVGKPNLIQALSHAHSIVEKKNAIPILSNIKIEAINNHLHIFATDMDVAVTEVIEATVIEEGSLTVSAQLLYDIVKKFPDMFINLAYNKEKGILEISGSHCKYTLPVIPVAEFPLIEEINSEHSFNIGLKSLKKLIDQTKFAISLEENRYNLNGIYLHPVTKDNKFYYAAAATDGHRLSLSMALLDQKIENLPSVILPKKTAFELRKILDNLSIETVNIQITDSKIRFTIGNINLISKVIDGNFPNYDNFIPKNNNYSVRTKRSHLAEVIDRISIMTLEKFRAIKLDFTTNKITLSSYGESGAMGVEEVEAFYNNKDFHIGFNPRYLLDILSVIEHDEIDINFGDDFSPTIIKDIMDDNILFIVMPAKV